MPASYHSSLVERQWFFNNLLEKVASLAGIRLAPTAGGNLTGLAPDDSPLVVRNVGNQEIYALDLELP
jgi:hypothetical protein